VVKRRGLRGVVIITVKVINSVPLAESALMMTQPKLKILIESTLLIGQWRYQTLTAHATSGTPFLSVV
jgi:hypothetical protein